MGGRPGTMDHLPGPSGCKQGCGSVLSLPNLMQAPKATLHLNPTNSASVLRTCWCRVKHHRLLRCGPITKLNSTSRQQSALQFLPLKMRASDKSMKPETTMCVPLPLLPVAKGTPASELLHYHRAMGSRGTSSCSGSAFAPFKAMSCSSGSPALSGGNPW